MEIHRLRIQNFRRFAEANFQFDRQFNLLVGENGAGKTSILDALAVGMASWLLGIRGYDSKHIEPEEYRVILKNYEREQTRRLEAQFPVGVTCSGRVLDLELTWSRSVSGKGGKTTQAEAKEIKELASETEKRVRAGDDITLPVIAYYGTERLWREPKDPSGTDDARTEEFDERFQGYECSVDPRINQASLLRWLRLEKFKALERGLDSASFKASKRVICSCIEECTGADYSVAETALLIHFSNAPTLPFQLLSDGIRSVVAMVADLAQKACQLNPHLGSDAPNLSPGIVLIDELDLHIHPRWQRHIAQDLMNAFPRVQFFATTHSPQIIGELAAKHIFMLNENGATHPTLAKGLSSNHILDQIMGAKAISAEVLDRINEVFELVETEQIDLAKERINKVRDTVGNLPELDEAEIFISRFENP